MKIIDLLNKIANGEEIKAFKLDNYIFKYDMDRENWKNENDDVLSTYCNVEECLNDEVEIIEEEKKIEKIDYCEENTFGSMKETTCLSIKEQRLLDSNFKTIKDKFDELIDEVNKLKEGK